MKKNDNSLGQMPLLSTLEKGRKGLSQKGKSPPPDESDNGRLILEVAQGNRDSYRLLYERFFHPILKVILAYVKHREVAEEITQDFFSDFWDKAPRYKNHKMTSPEAFLFRWARNFTIDYLRVDKSSREKNHTFNDQGYTPSDPLLREEKFKKVHQALSRLPENQYLALMLKEMEGLSLVEIAQILDTTDRAVEGLLYRGRKKLIQWLGQYFEAL